MAELDKPTPEWGEALRLVRAIQEKSGAERENALSEARNFLSLSSAPRLRSFARLLAPGASDKSVFAALVPLERVDSRLRVTDADIGIRDSDSTARTGSREKLPVIVVADNLRSAFNVGGLFRTADFFAVDALWLCGYTATPENAQVVRAALGAQEWVEWKTFPDIRDAIAEARGKGRKIYALETADTAKDIEEMDFSFPAVLLLGSERFGLDADVVAAADGIVSIPGHGNKNSLNVVCAFAVAAAAMRRNVARRARPLSQDQCRRGDFPQHSL